jgi:hypothetical protein
MGGGGSKKAAPPPAPRPPPVPVPDTPGAAQVKADMAEAQMLALLRPQYESTQKNVDAMSMQAKFYKANLDKAIDDDNDDEIDKHTKLYDAHMVKLAMEQSKFDRLSADIDRIERTGRNMHDAKTKIAVSHLEAEQAKAAEIAAEKLRAAAEEQREAQEKLLELQRASAAVEKINRKAEAAAAEEASKVVAEQAREKEERVAKAKEKRIKELNDEAERKAQKEERRHRLEEAQARAAGATSGAAAAASFGASMPQAPAGALDVDAARAAEAKKIANKIALPE